MLPLTAYALLNISEKVAQNERSIFTFLANDEKGSLINIVENGSEELLSVDVVYDYFQNMFRTVFLLLTYTMNGLRQTMP